MVRSSRSLAGMVKPFRSDNPQRKSAEQYRDIFREALAHLQSRLKRHRSRKVLECHPDLRSEGEPPYGLGKTILPAFKEKLCSFSLAFTPSIPECDVTNWCEGILNHLVEIDDLLEEIDLAIISIWRGIKPNHVGPIILAHYSVRVRQLIDQVNYLLASQLRNVFTACQTYFENFGLSDPPLDELSTINESSDILRLTAVSMDQIDFIVKKLHETSLGAVLEEWRKIAKQIDLSSQWPLKEPRMHPFFRDIPGHDELMRVEEEARKKAFQAATPIIKLCRTYFNKLSRSTNSQPLIFLSPSMSICEDRVDGLLDYTMRNAYVTPDFVKTMVTWSHEPPTVLKAIDTLRSMFVEFTPMLEKYWDSLSASNEQWVHREALADARAWLNSWSSLFSIATENLIAHVGGDDAREATTGEGETRDDHDDEDDPDSEDDWGNEGSDVDIEERVLIIRL
ncbi:hypothetical protein MJO28_015635 [Puccinia striiformis f. sp. tritici]|uniref:Uncharacterized protein n=2 Tax=Puccinia striiformis f. sp. tritici TaxID=168172 RepID=A0A0L0VNT6_9BASI|nr:hypothetical protein Pst134EB_030028 [Puccinia striiformis f. sp. tritici]KAI7936445.1 hypothetical protein MJO29_015748 [Puccinia striiformis f. sp. tritici]KAI7936736.1 hypothetical protein MJO28_015635 [Puccinia striiformis f. sp. tritici]KAI9624183.1 hypothetical protein KEM48_009081 [Puccinia striiformis f. sp. tritici PST-130]KNF00943.1 hypothetical protein PSTG_05838 [Puccinia striiformis f. sp. tritici PST-78]